MSLTLIAIFWGLLTGVAVLVGAAVFARASRTPVAKIGSAFLGIGAIICLITSFAGVKLGTAIAQDNAARYSEFWNGYEKEAVKSSNNCTRDGDCAHTYECDHYWDTETYTETDSEGNTVTKTRQVRKHHDCPYATVEIDWVVKTTIGDVTVVSNGFEQDPKVWDRRSVSLPGSVHRGEPALWKAAADRISSGDPGPVTMRKEYKNYILASQSTILKRYEGAIEQYKTLGLLPAPAGAIRDLYHADKLSFVKYAPADDAAWQRGLSKLNAAVGTELLGDLHVVIIDQSAVSSPDEYAGALSAWWQSKEFGKEALSKNGIGVVLGTDGQTVTWARAFTGMPLGNEDMIQDLRSKLEGQALDPATLFGSPVASFGEGPDYPRGVKVTHGNGVLEQVLWGPHRFERVCMECDGEDGAGFKYLKEELEPDAGQRRNILIPIILIELLTWISMVLWSQMAAAEALPAPRALGSKLRRRRDRSGW